MKTFFSTMMMSFAQTVFYNVIYSTICFTPTYCKFFMLIKIIERAVCVCVCVCVCVLVRVSATNRSFDKMLFGFRKVTRAINGTSKESREQSYRELICIIVSPIYPCFRSKLNIRLMHEINIGRPR
jgi:hypothetical protein